MDDDDFDFAIKTTFTNKGQQNKSLSQAISMEVQDVKEESENDEVSFDVVIKEEDSDRDDRYFAVEDEPFLVEPENNEEEKIDVRLTSLPIVFTTRLDDMHVLKLQNDAATTNNIFNCILKESIPKYDNQKPVKKLYSKRSFIALKQKIDCFNKKVLRCRSSDTKKNSTTNNLFDVALQEAQISMEAYLRNEKLIKLCKPCSVILVRTKIEGNDIIKVKENRKNQSLNMFLNSFNRAHRLSMKQKAFLLDESCCLVFYDITNKQVDVYCTIGGKIKESFILKDVDDVSQISHISEYKKLGIYPRIVPCCCWHQREVFINSLDFKVFKANIKGFMKKPHPCKFDQCTCCCRPITDKIGENNAGNTSTKFSLRDVEIKALDKEISATLCGIKQQSVEYGYKNEWLENLLDGKKGVETLVNKALNYTRPSHMLSEAKNINVSKKLKTKTVMQIHNNDNVEFVELQEEGDIVAYMKENSGSSFRNALIKLEVAWNTQFSCCWFKREQIISNLKLKTRPSLQRFLKLPHNCLPGKCRCCCKPQETISHLINIDLPQKSARFNTKVIKQLNIAKQTKETAIYSPQITQRPVTGLSTFKPQAKEVTPIKILPKPASSQKNKVPPGKSEQKVNKQSQQNEKMQYMTDPPVDIDQELAVDSLITSILDRFRDVRLTINEDGKVAAALNVPVDTLTTSELKVLANILAHAQAQVKELGLRPGSLLNAKDLQGSPKSLIQSQDFPLKLVENTDHSTDAQTIDSSKITNQILPLNNSKIQSNLQSEHSVMMNQQKLEPIPKNHLLKTFSDMSQYNSSSLMQSYTSFIRAQNKPSSIDQNNSENSNHSNETFIPKIENVFSLRDAENNSALSESVKLSALNAWSESESANKRKTVNSETQPPSKIRVVDPAKLGIASTTGTFEKTTGNLNLIGTQLHSYSTQPTYVPTGITLLPSSGIMGNGIIAELNTTTSTVTSNTNNIIIVNSLGSVGSVAGDNMFISPKNTNNLQLVTPLNINTIAQNIPMNHRPKCSTVFTISNLDKATVAEPRLLNADPVTEPNDPPQLLVPQNKLMSFRKNKFMII